MKKFMETCYKCKSKVKLAKTIKDEVELECVKCENCGEEYFTSSELIKYDILTGKRKITRKFGVLGKSVIMRFPTKIMKRFKVKPGDYGVIEEKTEGILIRPYSSRNIKDNSIK